MADLNELNEKVEQIKADIREQLEKIENTKGVYEYKKTILAKNGITKFNSLILRILSNRQFVFS